MTKDEAQEIIRAFRRGSPEERERLLVDVSLALKHLTRDDPARYFPAHEQQRKARASVADITLLLGGNRAGKSATAKLIIADVVRRRSPINERLTWDEETQGHTRPVDRPLTIWVATPTLEKFRRDWLHPADPEESLGHMLGDAYADLDENPDIVLHTKFGDHIIAKSYDQGYLSFESSSVDLVILDEEPPTEKIVNSCLMRLATNNGAMVMVFTPLEGLSWSYRRYFQPIVKRGHGALVSDRCWRGTKGKGGNSVLIVQTGMSDNPKAAAAAKRLEADESMLPAEKGARLYGDYGFAEGTFLPRLSGLDLLDPAPEHRKYVIDELPPIAGHYLIADPNYRYGASLWAIDGDGNRIALRQHLEEEWVTHQHAKVFNEWLRYAPNARQFADMGAAGKYATNELNREHGFHFRPVPKPAGSVSESIKILRGWTVPDLKHVHPITGERGAPRLYFYRPTLLEKYKIDGDVVDGSRLIDEMGMARQEDNPDAPPDSPHKTQRHSLDLFDCARYFALVSRPIPLPEYPMGGPHRDPDRLPVMSLRREERYDPANPDFSSPPETEDAWLPM